MFKRNFETPLFWFLILILAIAFLGVEYPRVGDLQIYLDAARDLFTNKNIYAELYGDHKFLNYMGSPTLAFLLSPLTWIPKQIAALSWKLFNLILLIRIWQLLKGFIDWEGFSKKQYRLFLLLTFVGAAHLLYITFHMVQFTIFMLYCILESLHQIRTKKYPVFGIGILGLGIFSKLLPLVMIPYLIYRGYWKQVLGLLGVLVLLMVLPAIFLGWERNAFIYEQWFHMINPLNQENTFDVATRSVHSIASLISTLTIEGIGSPLSLGIKRNIVNLNPEVVSVLILLVRLSLVLGTLYVLKAKRIFRDHTDKLHQLWELSYILLVTPLIFPHQRIYAFLFILPALFYLMYGFLKQPGSRSPFRMSVFILALVILNLDLILGNFREYYWHYKTLTYGVLMIMGLLIWMAPEKVGREIFDTDFH